MKQQPTVGAEVKVHLPGESPWAECIAVYDDGSWDGRILNRLFHEMSEFERAQVTNRDFKTVRKLPRLHTFKQNDTIRFELEKAPAWEIWVPRDTA